MSQIPIKDLSYIEGLKTFFIIPALSGSTIGNLFSTHPPVEKRIQKLMGRLEFIEQKQCVMIRCIQLLNGILKAKDEVFDFLILLILLPICCKQGLNQDAYLIKICV
jgi:hypothetical protein